MVVETTAQQQYQRMYTIIDEYNYVGCKETRHNDATCTKSLASRAYPIQHDGATTSQQQYSRILVRPAAAALPTLPAEVSFRQFSIWPLHIEPANLGIGTAQHQADKVSLRSWRIMARQAT